MVVRTVFDYCGDINASLEDFQTLLATVVRETFPTAVCKVCIRQTKAMRDPKISISIVEGPLPGDLAAAIPLLLHAGSGARWAYCGKVLPALGWWVRANKKSSWPKYSKVVWDQMRAEDTTLRDCKPHWVCPPRDRQVTFARHQQRLSDYVKAIHPAMPSPTLAQIERGDSTSIVQIATEQRRDDLDRATPKAVASDAAGVSTPPKRARL